MEWGGGKFGKKLFSVILQCSSVSRENVHSDNHDIFYVLPSIVYYKSMSNKLLVVLRQCNLPLFPLCQTLNIAHAWHVYAMNNFRWLFEIKLSRKVNKKNKQTYIYLSRCINKESTANQLVFWTVIFQSN